MGIRLIKLTYEYKDQLIEMIEEWTADIKKNNTNHSPWAIFRNDCHDFDYYLENLDRKEEIDGRPMNTVFFGLDEERNILVGAVDIRKYLNDDNCKLSGHIGDGIRPNERRKGYATKMLLLAKEECRKLGINKILMTCDEGNEGSEKSIINAGGVYEATVEDIDGNKEKRFWITTYDEKIDTKRLTLRRAMPSDYLDIRQWSTDPRVCKYLLRDAAPSDDDRRPWLYRADPNSKTRILMIARDKSDNSAIGMFGCFHNVENDTWEISYTIKYDAWGKGYTTEAATALIDHVYLNYGARHFIGEHAKENVASGRVLEKLGFKYDHDSSYTKHDGVTTYESRILKLDK